MKKLIIILLALSILLISTMFIIVKDVSNYEKEIAKFNSYYEYYLDKTIFGTEVATLIGKAIDNNEKYEISKAENNTYIPDGKYSVKIYISLFGGKAPYEMEVINKLGISSFITNFNVSNFKCTQIKYHEESKRVSELYIEEIYE